jgi:sugar fermentation stimulation protein A
MTLLLSYQEPIFEGRFLRRYKRFFIDVENEFGDVVTLHNPNTGSMRGLLNVGARVLYSYQGEMTKAGKPRVLQYTCEAIENEAKTCFVNVQTHRTNIFALAAVQAGLIIQKQHGDVIRTEVVYGQNSRIDILIEREHTQKEFIEVKNTSLVEQGCAYFPDSVSIRGQKHLHELKEQVLLGYGARMLFVVPRTDAQGFLPAKDIDKDYAEIFWDAYKSGVKVSVAVAEITKQGWFYRGELPLFANTDGS